MRGFPTLREPSTNIHYTRSTSSSPRAGPTPPSRTSTRPSRAGYRSTLPRSRPSSSPTAPAPPASPTPCSSPATACTPTPRETSSSRSRSAPSSCSSSRTSAVLAAAAVVVARPQSRRRPRRRRHPHRASVPRCTVSVAGAGTRVRLAAHRVLARPRTSITRSACSAVACQKGRLRSVLWHSLELRSDKGYTL